MIKKLMLLTVLLVLTVVGLSANAQGELAATLEVLDDGVEVRRVNTEQWIPVSIEAIVGVGDQIRTNDDGRARIIFFADGTDTELLPNTEYQIDRFEGDDDSFNLSVTVLAGQTLQRVNRILDADSSYDVNTPGMDMVARGTAFAVRVEPNGRAAMLVTEGIVGASADDSEASVDPGFGIRSEEGSALSDVVRADHFGQLDAALDGCSASVTTPDDVLINVRLGAGLDYQRIGGIAADEIDIFVGASEDGSWYRINFDGGFGWILSSTAEVIGACDGLRQFPANHGPEDPSLYSSIDVEVESLPDDATDAETDTDTDTDG